MKKYILLLLSVFCFFLCESQTEANVANGKELYESAQNYLHKGDYSNAIMVFNQAVQIEPTSLLYRRDLAYAYFLQGDMMKAQKIITPLLKAEEADPETFLIATKVNTKMNNTEEAKEAINKGISKYPNIGFLYEEKGQLYTILKKHKDATEAWEEGIKSAPNYHVNYYNLSKSYYFNKKYLWAILYGETFVNLESFTSKTEEIKKIVFESYKFLIAELNNQQLDKGDKIKEINPDNFDEACMYVYNNIKNTVTGGINSENLVMLRTRFLLEWNKTFAQKYPLELIDFQHKMILQGYYDCYNAWLFGRIDNEKNFVSWTQKNATLMNKYDLYFRANKLYPKPNQYYK